MYRTNTHDRSLADQLCRTRHNLPPSPPLVHSNETSYNLSVRERLKKRGCCVIVYYSISIIFRYKYFFFFFSNRETEWNGVDYSYEDFYNESTNDSRTFFFFFFSFLRSSAVVGRARGGAFISTGRTRPRGRLWFTGLFLFFSTPPPPFSSPSSCI